MYDGINTYSGSNITMNQCFELSLQKRKKLKQTTIIEYKSKYDRYFRDSIGSKRINTITQHHLISIYSSLLSRGIMPSTLENINICITPLFSLAKKNGWIQVNPTEGVLAEMKNLFPWGKRKKKGLTEEEQEIFMRVVRESPRFQCYYPLFTFLLGTGCRIGEALALQWEDCNFTTGLITIKHTLIYMTEKEDPESFHMGSPKTTAGERIIPMLSEVRTALQIILEARNAIGMPTTATVDGFHNFVFLTTRGRPLDPHNLHRIMRRLVESYNESELVASRKEKRDPVFLPPITPHTLRHTFCSRLCEHETNLKVIQEIMGHKNITVTMDVYNEATEKKKKECFANLDGKIKIS